MNLITARQAQRGVIFVFLAVAVLPLAVKFLAAAIPVIAIIGIIHHWRTILGARRLIATVPERQRTAWIVAAVCAAIVTTMLLLSASR